MSPIISVVMSVYNGEKYLREAIESISNQTYTDFEFIIINDGSTDNTAEILRSYNDSRIKVLTQKNMGLSTSLNKGIRQSSGQYIARMDADDISHCDRLQRQLEFMDNHPECVALGTQAVMMSKNGEKIYASRIPLDDNTLRAGLPTRCPFIHGSVMLRRKDAIYSGGYPENVINSIEDIILWNIISKQGELRNLSSALYFYRIVPGSMNVYSTREINGIKKFIQKAADGEKEINENDLIFINSLRIQRKHINSESYYYLKLGKVFLDRLTICRMRAYSC